MAQEVIATPKSWITPAVFGEFLSGLDPRSRPGSTIDSRILAELIVRTAVPTHTLRRHNGQPPVFTRVKSGSQVDREAGSGSLISLVDEQAAKQAGLDHRHYETISRFNAIGTLAAGVWLPSDTEPIKDDEAIPFVAEIGGFDFRAEQLYDTEGLLQTLRICQQEGMRQKYNSLVALFKGMPETGDRLRSMAIPLGSVTLLTHRGLEHHP